jgi:YD repeat-containing protein
VDGNLATEKDPNGNTFTHGYDGANNLIRTTFPDGTSVNTTFDFAHRPVTRTNESGRMTRYVYDKAGRSRRSRKAMGLRMHPPSPWATMLQAASPPLPTRKGTTPS